MSINEIIFTILAIGIVIGGVLLLQQSAKKFDLTPEQLKEIKKRNEDLDKEDKENN
jgi:hypothetical protein